MAQSPRVSPSRCVAGRGAEWVHAQGHICHCSPLVTLKDRCRDHLCSNCHVPGAAGHLNAVTSDPGTVPTTPLKGTERVVTCPRILAPPLSERWE